MRRDEPVGDLHELHRLLGRVRNEDVRRLMEHALALWEDGHFDSAIKVFRQVLEAALHRVLHRLEGRGAPEGGDLSGLPKILKALSKGQIDRTIRWLHEEARAAPTNIALHLHTLRSWGNEATHWDKTGFRAHFSDLTILVPIVLKMEDWIAQEIEGGRSIFEREDLGSIVRSVEAALTGAGLPMEMGRAFVEQAGGGSRGGPHGLAAPHLSMELLWQAPEAKASTESPFRGLQSFGPEDAACFFLAATSSSRSSCAWSRSSRWPWSPALLPYDRLKESNIVSLIPVPGGRKTCLERTTGLSTIPSPEDILEVMRGWGDATPDQWGNNGVAPIWLD